MSAVVGYDNQGCPRLPAATASCPQIAGCGVQICDFEPSESVLEHPEDVGLPTLNIQGLLPVNRPSSMQRLLAALPPGGMNCTAAP